jgi:hypothetical protein
MLDEKLVRMQSNSIPRLGWFFSLSLGEHHWATGLGKMGSPRKNCDSGVVGKIVRKEKSASKKRLRKA